ncbi:chromosome segregation protein SMC [Kocuria tytonicola]|uniref:chromosome segregation protein SMC n=1 Tax=Kocuria tytonicola TaxID=2055946 RepID=UPI000EF8D39A|nr:chromosome segregation protein SMC [Kocuria tytonicola]RLZ03294.1 chromosome segregation protein SMC [Kocuria tytonicola]
MHLKTLTVRGFKSFASATTFHFEPGVTAVVGPNGSGKSNVVDALAWVMGEQGAKSLRGGKMEDVIFAGTSGRAALGRAHVSLTIDNADGALPIEYTEVTISRTLFRSGGSEYAINGRSCRLLDIQELLSDSGLGREMHVIVGQGQLDRILQATAEERRGFIEEASGILKHRRRKEKTLRKLESVQQNLDRLEDLTGEIERQLTPLGRQARTARKAQRIQYDVRDARARLLADDLVAARAGMDADRGASDETRRRKDELEQAVARLDERLARTEADAARTAPALNAARTSWYELSTVRDRFRALSALAGERRRLLGSEQAPEAPGRDAQALEEQAQRSREEAERLAERVARAQQTLNEAQTARQAAEETARGAERRTAELVQRSADRRAGQARLAAAVTSARSALSAAESDVERVRAEIADVASRAEQATLDTSSLRDAAETSAGAVERSATRAREAEEHAETARAAARAAESARQTAASELHAAQVRLDTLRQSVRQPDGSAAVADATAVLGSVPDAVRVAPGWERAVTAALGAWSEALAVGSAANAATVFAALREAGSGRVHLVLTGTAPAPSAPLNLSLPEGCVPAASVLSPAPGAGDGDVVLRSVRAELARTVLVPGPAEALAVLDAAAAAGEEASLLRAVTRDGDVHGTRTAQGGATEAAGNLEILARIEAEEARLDGLRAAADKATAEAERAEMARAEAARAQREASQQAQKDQQAAAAAGAALSRAEATASSADSELARRREVLGTAEQRMARRQEELREALERAESAEHGDEAELEREQITAAGAKDRADAAAKTAREAETEARLALRGLEEQHRHALSRAEGQLRAARSERAAQAEAARRAERRRVQAAVARAVGTAAEHLRVSAEESARQAAAQRDAVETERAGLDEAAHRLRTERDGTTRELSELTERLHRAELELTQRRARLEGLEATALEELGMTPDFLVEHYGPHLPVPDADAAIEAAQTAEESGGSVQLALPSMTDPGTPFRREEQQTRLQRAQKQLKALGKVNPLALEEFAALEERHKFLVTQLEDVKNSRTDLRNIIRQVDQHVEEVFSQAYRDTAEQFVSVFATLFPGGEGRLRLTDPDDMLNSGVEVEARPAGKKIKRLSLLSGGERSLTALALLVAIFKARPSPFYVMDEVEAALDDRNLGRLLTIFEQLQESSQLIIVTHQKRTMEIADALYGVSMRGDGVSLVVGQQLSQLR